MPFSDALVRTELDSSLTCGSRTAPFGVARASARSVMRVCVRLVTLACALGLLLSSARAYAAEEPPSRLEALAERIPKVALGNDLTGFTGRTLAAVVFRERGQQLDTPLVLKRVKVGETFSASLARRAMLELLDSGKYAELETEVELHGEGVTLRLTGVSRKVVAEVQVEGGVFDREATLDTAKVNTGTELTRDEVAAIAERLTAFYRKRGYPKARIYGDWTDTGTWSRVVLTLHITPGPPRPIATRRFAIEGAAHPELTAQLERYDIGVGMRADEVVLSEADRALEQALHHEGWFRAKLGHRLQGGDGGAELIVDVTPGQRYRVRVEGNRTFDGVELLQALDLPNQEEVTEQSLVTKLQNYYVDRGFLDAHVVLDERPHGTETDWVLVVRENHGVRVVGRSFPCLQGQRSANDVNAEIDGVLGELLPGGNEWLGPASPEVLDRNLGTSGGQRPELFQADPWQSYAPNAYDKAVTHLRELYRSEGYLSAIVGPVAVLRRACSPLSAPGQCKPVGVRVAPEATCPTAQSPFPTADPPPRAEFNCKPDPLRGIYCEPNVVLSIPVKLGPRTTLWDLEFAGNTHLTEVALAEAADLTLGAPVSQAELQKARRRILDLYADEGYAFATVDVDLLLSQDQTRGSARFIVGEREQVEISQIVVHGAERTQTSVILARLDLVRGGIYKRPLVRQSEEQLATLGVFSSVAISLQDPDVPAKRKVVQVTVAERLPQYVDVKPGFSTGEGPRVSFEYGHRNLGGRAIQLRFRVQLGYLPGFLLFEDEVRRNFDRLSLADRIERRDTVTLELPVAKRYRLAFEGVDARDNSRDFGLTKRAVIPSLTYRPSRAFSMVGGASFELNDARVFGDTQNLQQYLEAHPEQVRLLNVPEGRSFAVALRLGGAWDRTDVPLSPTRGTLLTLEVEPVRAALDEDSAVVQLNACQVAGNDPSTCEYRSFFLRVTGRAGGYIPFNDSGLSLALNLRVGVNHQLVDHSSTYPDRLFFLGGADSLRGFLQASVIPQDIADELVDEDPNAADRGDVLTARKVVIRGGDFLINPRAELRIPVTKLLHTALFVDAGNLWRNVDNVEPFRLRYTAGTGLRIVTPVGPLAFDYGFILDRRFYETSIGAFHFSIGLY